MYYSKPMKEPVLTCTTKDYNTEINMQSCESKPQENSTIKKTIEVSIINILYRLYLSCLFEISTQN